MDWTYPVYVSEEEKAIEASTAETVGQLVRRALPREESFAWISGDDRRPLMVLRECKTCNGTDYALLNRSEDNEKTLLYSRWFNCVKLPEDVLEEDHPFRNLFPDKKIPHLFMASPDGSNFIPLDGQQSRSELWDGMETLLKVEYKKDAKKATREMMKLLVQYDHLDSMEEWRTQQLEALLEKDGPKSSKVKKIKKQIDKLRTDKEKVKKKEVTICDLEFKKPLPAKEKAVEPEAAE